MPGILLVADDDDDIRHELVEALTEEGYTVLQAKDGEEVLALALTQRPDAIVLDHRMPGRTGAEVVKTLRDSGSSIPIILTTAGKDPQVLALDLECFLRKPFGLEDLLVMVKRALDGGC